MSRPSAQQSQNTNNFITDRSSTRSVKPPGGGSTVGSLIFGGNDAATASYADDRKGRRGMGSRPEQTSGSQVFHQDNSQALVKSNNAGSGGGGNNSKEADKYALQQQQYLQQQMDRRGPTGNQGSSDIFLRNAPAAIAGERRTKRMYGGGQSDFKLS
ncbi:Aste57867_14417 [Aphanomyces stellatus]|uniref:Aste57867_14417 protein n=1 Tax=Aphanomyces stellatus TaxID=120398 RepID=A0A485L160_9STRA|nr:hypothetical protein As57867_014363 [Aphanomyces stellatus]VFT91239.1 Aste57867_14417 [Aphanomyces stellatus]